MKTPGSPDCARCALRPRCVIGGCDPLAAGEQGVRTQVLHAHQTLFCEGGPALSVHTLRSGRVKLFKLGYGGEEFVLGVCEPGFALGLAACIAGAVHEATAEAVEDCEVCSLPLGEFRARMERSHVFAYTIALQLAFMTRTAHERMVELAQRGVVSRVAHLLVDMIDGSPGAGPRPVAPAPGLRMKRRDMAHLVGTTPETLSRVLHKLQARGVLEVTREHIAIRDARKLRAIAGLFSLL